MTERSGSGQGLLGALDRIIHGLTQLADQLAALVCAFLIAATTFAVVIYQQGITIVWLDDLLRMLLIWLVYLGAVSLCFHNDHITMDVVYLRLPVPVRRALDIVIAVLGIALCTYVAKIGADSMLREIGYGTLLPSGYLPAWPQTLSIPLCFALMTVAYLSFLYAVLTNRRQARAPDDLTQVP
jgi:TRAP-type C4-dicarboxylate transport system permease small subunit